jgi:hypothetical protein
LRHFLCGVAVDILDKGKRAADGILVVQVIAVDFWDWDVCVLGCGKGLALRER